MAKTKISEYSATSADNTDISNINIAEGCSPANINNAIRTVMAQLKDFQSGNGTYYTSNSDGLAVGAGGTGAITAASARTNLSAAQSGANSDITSLSGMTTALSVAQGGTGGTTASAAKTALSAASSGANSDITSLTGLTTALSVAQGGTGRATITSGNLVLGNGTNAVSLLAAGTAGNVLTSDGTTWSSAGKITTATEQNPSSSASITFSSIPSWVKRITIMTYDVALSGALQVQIGAGSTTTTGYVSSSGLFGGSNIAQMVNATNCFVINSNVTAGQSIMTLTNFTGNTWMSSHNWSAASTYSGSGTGKIALSGALDRVVISPASGTLSSGSINIIYE
jgi:hypothetical protein